MTASVLGPFIAAHGLFIGALVFRNVVSRLSGV